MTQHYLTAQKAIDGLKLNFKSKKARPAAEKLHPSDQQNAVCDCCAMVTQGGLTTIESNQKLCNACLKELRG
jgi:hypothetical protein